MCSRCRSWSSRAYQQGGFSVHEQFPHLNWLSRALAVALVPQSRYWESNSPGDGKEAGSVLGDVLAAAGTTWKAIAREGVQGRCD